VWPGVLVAEALAFPAPQCGIFSTSPGARLSGLAATDGLAARSSSRLTLYLRAILSAHSPGCTVWTHGPSVASAVGVASSGVLVGGTFTPPAVVAASTGSVVGT